MGCRDEGGAGASTALLPCQRHLFTLPEDVVYLSCASRAPLLRSTEAVGHAAVSVKNEPWRIGSDSSADDIRSLFAGMIGSSAEYVALTPSTSYALSQAAANILRRGLAGPGDALVVLEDQMSSNMYPWQWLCRHSGAYLYVVRRPPSQSSWTEAVAASLVALRAAGTHVAVLAVPQYLWTDGSGPLDLRQLGCLCREPAVRRTIFVVDVTQSLGVVPLDVRECQIDWLAASVHKWLLGPYGLCCCYVNEEWWADPAEPLVHDEHSRLGADQTDLEFELARPGYEEAFQPGARRFDSGGRGNPILLPMVRSALEQVAKWQPEIVGKSIEQLMVRLTGGARALGLSVPEAGHAPHFVGIGPGPEDVPATGGDLRKSRNRWADDAAAWLKERSIFVTARFGVLRVAPHLYNTEADIDAFLRVLADFLATRRRHQGAAAEARL